MEYPHDLSKLTDDQIAESMQYYLSLDLNNLRRKQLVVKDQLERIERGEYPGHIVGHRNLQIMAAMMHVAVDRVAFPEDHTVDVTEEAIDMIHHYT
ncbi:MAG: hypothetical protein K8L99_07975, partial [Anaerolineae bacterium]|nr:hypothetical protein [Anaerolineae bacterium]